MKVASFDIVFQEIPGEVTLALNFSNCPCHCQGCHSPHLAEDIGEPLTEELLSGLIDRYGARITCVAFMGGDAEPKTVAKWAEWIKNHKSQFTNHKSVLRTAWYSGRPSFPNTLNNQIIPNTPTPFDYVKLGPYVEALGGLKSEKTNQRLYKRVGDKWEDITSVFWKKRFE